MYASTKLVLKRKFDFALDFQTDNNGRLGNQLCTYATMWVSNVQTWVYIDDHQTTPFFSI